MALFEKPKKILLSVFVHRCPGCGAVMERGDSLLCRWCMLRLYRSPADRIGGLQVHTAFLHAGVAREMVLRLKFHGERHLARVLASLALNVWSDKPVPEDTVVPVPSSGERIRERGYNQAALIAGFVARASGARFESILFREPGGSQIGTGAEEREMNVKGKFFCRKTIPSGRIWLVDDVVTTGATLAENTRVLRFRGMRRIVPAAVCFQRMNDDIPIDEGEGADHGCF